MFISKKTFREMLVCAPVIFNQILIGLGWGWTAPMVIKLQNANSVMSVSPEQASWIASVHEVGRLTGPFISPFIVDRIGRKYSTMLITALLFLFWPSQIYIRNVYLLCLVRLIFGVTNGISDVVSSVYITENCTSQFRAVMGAVCSIMFAAGSLIELAIATYLTYRTTAIVNTVISVYAFSTLYFCIETPSFLILKDKYHKAVKNFLWLRGDPDFREVSNEFEELKSNIQEEKLLKKSLRTLFSSAANVRSIFIVASMYMIATATGGSATGAYAVMIFQPTEMFSPYQFTIISGILHFISVCISPFTVSKTSRKSLLIVGFSLIGICHMCTFSLFYLHNRNFKIAFYPWLVFASLTLCGSILSMSLPALFVIRVELLPLSVRAIGASTTVIISAVTGFCIVKTFQSITASFGMETNFFIYAFMSVLMSIFVYFIVPETRGKTVDEIQESLGKRSKFGEHSNTAKNLR